MTNYEKYKTPHERAVAFKEYCNGISICKYCPMISLCGNERTSVFEPAFAWLDLEEESEVAK